ncbi:DNA-binding protein [Sulfitobacter sp. JBTF-M27]|uniref:DNA-binding protein n=2 Tax=Sulfitobacter sediminilitoris TaxID=2698830 RepID=A0A6P0C8V3_9RHOB|nr:DNA-binding protein [Sulfitobacter sediminilitoris]
MRPTYAARYLGISQSKLAKLRMQNCPTTGPPFSKIAGMVVYRRPDLDRWVEENQVVDHRDSRTPATK